MSHTQSQTTPPRPSSSTSQSPSTQTLHHSSPSNRPLARSYSVMSYEDTHRTHMEKYLRELGLKMNVRKITIDYMDKNPETGKFEAGVTCVVRIEFAPMQDNFCNPIINNNNIVGCYKENLGFGMSENAESAAHAILTARQKAVDNAVDRTLEGFKGFLRPVGGSNRH